MAKASFIKSARKPIYERGKRVEYVSQKGKREGQTLSKIDRTIPADENDRILINKGESYWTWSFMYGGTYYSKTQPKPSQLTSSEFLSTVYGIQEEMDEWNPEDTDNVSEFVDDIKSRLEELRDETQDKLDNMPEQLQEADTGQLLQERIEALENAINEFDCLDDLEYEEPDEKDIKDQIAEDEGIDIDEEGWEDSITEEKIEEKKADLKSNWLEEKIEEIKNISIEV